MYTDDSMGLYQLANPDRNRSLADEGQDGIDGRPEPSHSRSSGHDTEWTCGRNLLRPYCHHRDGKQGLFERPREWNRNFSSTIPRSHASLQLDNPELSQLCSPRRLT